MSEDIRNHLIKNLVEALQSTASKKCMDLMDRAANDPDMIQASLCALIDYMRDGSNKERTLYRTVKQHLKSNLNKKTQGPDYN